MDSHRAGCCGELFAEAARSGMPAVLSYLTKKRHVSIGSWMINALLRSASAIGITAFASFANSTDKLVTDKSYSLTLLL